MGMVERRTCFMLSRCLAAAMSPRHAALGERAAPVVQWLRSLSTTSHRQAHASPRQDDHQTSHGNPKWSSRAAARDKNQVDKEFIVSVLEASATKRDAKGYIQKYNPSLGKPSLKSVQNTIAEPIKPASISRGPSFVQGPEPKVAATSSSSPLYVALVKFRLPQAIDDQTLDGVAKTISQLRALGLLSVIVVDCGADSSLETMREQSYRISYAINRHDSSGATTIDRLVQRTASGPKDRKEETTPTTALSLDAVVGYPGAIESALRRGAIPVVPAILDQGEAVDGGSAQSRDVILALIRYFSGLQSLVPVSEDITHAEKISPVQHSASVERIIVLDPLGGIPVEGYPRSWHRFINLEHEYKGIIDGLESNASSRTNAAAAGKTVPHHIENLRLAKDALSFLPSTSSAIITTPAAAANLHPPASNAPEPNMPPSPPGAGFIGTVKTRSVQNPLIHNLLTDKPVHSSSLPLREAPAGRTVLEPRQGNNLATLIKRGMPLTIYPDPLATPWVPPTPGSPRLRLTDTCVDLPRLVHLIEDSFGRKLDVQHYLDRVNENLAGIIIAGEYEGGAILTWERPSGLDETTASQSGRIVPYLDKFAVLKSRQGSGGVADIVFNAMVHDCFPEGVCWRSRVDNPVNKWYFERSTGTLRLRDGMWTMFWTTPNLAYERFLDYEDVCLGVVPSWADKKHLVD